MKYTKFYSTIALMLMCAVTFGQTAGKFAELDQFFNNLEKEDRIMGTVVVSSGEKSIYEWNSGTAWFDGEELRDNEIQTAMGIGSATKMLTAAMTLQLVEDGMLDLDRRLADFFPEIKGAEDISIRQMLGHRSGIHNFTSDREFLYWMHQKKDREEMLNLFETFELAFEPGSQVAYSNTNYVLLGYILEDVTGLGYGQLLDRQITGPLGMEHTYFTREDVPAELRSHSFIRTDYDWITMVPELNLNTAHGAGGVVSTGRDMNLFMNALFNGKLLSQESLEMMMFTEKRFGHGLLETPFHHHLGFGHYGSVDEYRSFVAHYPASDLSVSILANGLDGKFSEVIAGALSHIFESEMPVAEHSSVSLSDEELEILTGMFFNLETGEEFKVSVENGQLKISIDDMEVVYPIPVHHMLFEDTTIDTRFSFIFDKNGKAESLIIKNSDNIFILDRRESRGS